MEQKFIYTDSNKRVIIITKHGKMEMILVADLKFQFWYFSTYTTFVKLLNFSAFIFIKLDITGLFKDWMGYHMHKPTTSF